MGGQDCNNSVSTHSVWMMVCLLCLCYHGEKGLEMKLQKKEAI